MSNVGLETQWKMEDDKMRNDIVEDYRKRRLVCVDVDVQCHICKKKNMNDYILCFYCNQYVCRDCMSLYVDRKCIHC